MRSLKSNSHFPQLYQYTHIQAKSVQTNIFNNIYIHHLFRFQTMKPVDQVKKILSSFQERKRNRSIVLARNKCYRLKIKINYQQVSRVEICVDDNDARLLADNVIHRQRGRKVTLSSTQPSIIKSIFTLNGILTQNDPQNPYNTSYPKSHAIVKNLNYLPIQ